jgi:tRNA (cytidine/uridine-2'-O-)-methyltransferase
VRPWLIAGREGFVIDCALFQPDIPQNTGTILRLGACFGLPVHVIHPTGFALSDKNLRRAGMDYLDRAALVEHDDWSAFEAWRSASGRRLVALSTRGSTKLHGFAFRPDDVLLFGRESAGLPDDVLGRTDAVVRIPLRPEVRSLNLAVAAAIALTEALRQTDQLP